ncbi:MAG: hypothetical protein HIU93_15120 [Acidobacteria bacterium]|nr:hypothetical protein [Acidobacteriota bacterium]
MKVLPVILLSAFTSATFGQIPQDCRRAVSVSDFRIPAQIRVGQGPALGARNVTRLFSENGMDFYGLGRMHSQTGEPISENGAWIVGVFEDENRREAEAQHLTERIHNPHLTADYSSDLKFVVAKIELVDDRESAKYKAWLECSRHTSSEAKCPFPAQVPIVSEVFYFQPQECVISAETRGLLFDDSLNGIAYANRQYQAPPPLSFQPSLFRASTIMLDRFETEDQVKEKQVTPTLAEQANSCWNCIFPAWAKDTSADCQDAIANWRPNPETFVRADVPFNTPKFKEISFLFSQNGMGFYGAFPIREKDAFSGAIYTVIVSLNDENVRRAWAELILSKNEDQTLLPEDISHVKYVVANIQDIEGSQRPGSPNVALAIVGGMESFYEPKSCVLPGQKDRENAHMTNPYGTLYHHDNWLENSACRSYDFSPFHCANYGHGSTPDPLFIRAVKMMKEKNDHAKRPEQKRIPSNQQR